MLGLKWGDEYDSELRQLWSTNALIEPLGHTLLHEACSLAVESPSGAILIMVAAVETSIKTHISRVAPDTAWLMEELQSPPIFNVLRDYIPWVHQRRGEDMSFWTLVWPAIKKIKKLIEVRNKVAHTGKIPEDAEPVRAYLQVVSDILYLLDVLDGHEWAKQRVSHSARKLLEWPNPNNQRIMATITMG
jgi:hypothetical protein